MDIAPSGLQINHSAMVTHSPVALLILNSLTFRASYVKLISRESEHTDNLQYTIHYNNNINSNNNARFILTRAAVQSCMMHSNQFNLNFEIPERC